MKKEKPSGNRFEGERNSIATLTQTEQPSQYREFVRGEHDEHTHYQCWMKANPRQLIAVIPCSPMDFFTQQAKRIARITNADCRNHTVRPKN